MRAVSNPKGTLAAEVAAQNPDLAQTIEECMGDHGLNEMIEDCMNESAAMLAATEEWHQKAQVAAAPATLGTLAPDTCKLVDETKDIEIQRPRYRVPRVEEVRR